MRSAAAGMSAVSVPDPAAYSHRWVTALPEEAGGDYAVGIVDADEPDAECIAVLQDAVEARRHILIVARSVRGLAQAVAAFQFFSATERFYDTPQPAEIN